jgi:hypothetical protein
VEEGVTRQGDPSPASRRHLGMTDSVIVTSAAQCTEGPKWNDSRMHSGTGPATRRRSSWEPGTGPGTYVRHEAGALPELCQGLIGVSGWRICQRKSDVLMTEFLFAIRSVQAGCLAVVQPLTF